MRTLNCVAFHVVIEDLEESKIRSHLLFCLVGGGLSDLSLGIVLET